MSDGMELLPPLAIERAQAVVPLSQARKGRLAAIYARFSTHEDRESSVDRQLAGCRSLAARLGCGVYRIFVDRQVGGGFIGDRDGLTALLEAAERREFDVLVCEDIDRIGRDVADLTSIWRRLGVLGIEWHAVLRGPVDLMTITVVGFLSAEQRRVLAVRTQGGRNVMAARGLSPSGPCYGYRRVPGRPGLLAVDAAEADVVRRIHAMAMDGLTPDQIAKVLNADGVPGPSGGRWFRTAIWSCDERRPGLVQNVRYLGKAVHGRTRRSREPGSGKASLALRPPREWIVRDVPSLRIVDDELWNLANLRLQRPQKVRAVRRRAKHLLGTVLRCRRCTARMTATWSKGSTRFVCSSRRRGTGCSGSRSFTVGAVNRFMCGMLQREGRAGEGPSVFAAAYRAEVRRLGKRREGRLRDAEREIRRLDDQLRKSFETALVDGFSADWVAERRRDISGRLSALAERRDALRRPLSEPQPPELETALQSVFDRDRAGSLSGFDELGAALTALGTLELESAGRDGPLFQLVPPTPSGADMGMPSWADTRT